MQNLPGPDNMHGIQGLEVPGFENAASRLENGLALIKNSQMNDPRAIRVVQRFFLRVYACKIRETNASRCHDTH